MAVRSWSRRGPVAVVSLLTAVLGSACGLASTSDIFGPGGEDDGGEGGAGGTFTTSTGEGASGGDVSTGVTSSTSGPSSSSSSSSAAQSSSAMSSSSASSGGGGDAQVYCANAPCAAGEVCCFHFENPNLDHCGTKGTCGRQYMEITCNGPEDCPGQTCCGQWNGRAYTSVTCSPSCNSITVCGESPGVCDPALNCEQSGYLGVGYNVCK